MPVPPPPRVELTPVLELRARLERRENRDVSDARNDNSTEFLGRVRAGANLVAGSLRAQLIYQYAYGELRNFNAHASTRRSDLVLGNLQARLGTVGFTLGRQRLSYGGERLLGAADWNNVSNAWDGVRATFAGTELFAVKSGLLASPNDTLSLYGGARALGPVQLLAVFKHDERNDVDEATLSARLARRYGRVALDAEAAAQAGRRTGRSKLAGALDAIATLPLAPRFSLSGQFALASGGRSGGTTHTFDQLYASGHDKHGLVDLAGWQNLRDFGLWLRYEPDRRTAVKLQFHDLSLVSDRDAWYGAGGAPNARPGGLYVAPNGGRGRHLGDEIDLDASHVVDAHGTARAGVGLFRPGGFVRSFEGGDARDSIFAYAQYTYRF